MKGSLLAAFLILATVALVIVGTVWPIPEAVAFAGSTHIFQSSATPEDAVRSLGEAIHAQAWERAYSTLSNKAQFTQQEFIHDLTGYYPGLLTYTTLDHFDVQPIHASANDAEVHLKLYWSTVVGLSPVSRDLHLVRNGDQWQVDWPIQKRPVVPPQVIPVNYLRWDVINRGAGDDWGAQDVEAPHVRIVDMHPIQRADGVVVMGELLNEDVVPAYVSVNATLLAKDQSPIATEGSFDKISHLLLPKQVTPFLIEFHDQTLNGVAGIRMTPFSTLVPASADPVIEVDNEKLNPAPGATLTGQLINQSGEIVNIAHVLGTFYDKNGQVVWVADSYVNTALLPQTPVPFEIHIPEDLARRINAEHTTIASYTAGGAR